MEKKTVPESWGLGKVEALWKGKGSKLDPAMYRGLNIGSCAGKAVVNIILSRIQDWYEHQLTDNQYGFRSNRGTNDATYITKRFQQITNDQTTTGFLLFIDLSAAFDHLVRDWLWTSIRLRLPPELEDTTIIDILQNLYSKTTIEVEGINVETTSGVRQGGPESPPLFNLYVDWVMRIFMKHAMEEGLEFFKYKYRIPSTRAERAELRNAASSQAQLDWTGYADDTILYLMTLASLQNSLPLIDQIFKRYKLSVNTKKIESMTTNRKWSYNDDIYPDTVIHLDGKTIKNSSNFRYLGSELVHNQNTTGEWEIQCRIESARSKFASMINLFTNHKIHLSTRIVFLLAYVRSRLTYNCQNWTLTAEQFRKLDSTWMIFLRKMIRRGFERHGQENDEDDENDDNFKFRYRNSEVLEICKADYVSIFIRKQQRNYAAHVIRADNSCSTKRLMFQEDKCTKRGRNTNTLLKQVLKNENISQNDFIRRANNRQF